MNELIPVESDWSHPDMVSKKSLGKGKEYTHANMSCVYMCI